MKVRDFKGFMASKAVNEQENYEGAEAGMQYGANPEDEEMGDEFAEEGEGEEGMEEEPLTLEDLKAMIDDLTARVEALEPEEEEEGESEGEEGEEGEDAEGEEA